MFMDREELTLGRDFENTIKARLEECDTVLALIGPNWLDAMQGRLNGSDPDFVRMELELALSRGIPVVPVLLDNALLPRAEVLPAGLKDLVKRHGIAVGQQNFEADVTRLLKGVGVKVVHGTSRKVAGSSWLSWPMLLTLLGTAAIISLQHFLDFEEGDATPTVLGIGSIIAGMVAAGGHGLRSSESGGLVAFLSSMVGGLAAIVALMVAAGLVTPSLAGGFALLLSQLLRDASCFVAGLSGYLVGLAFYRREPRAGPARSV